jgi:polyvinyl alcohol dehydrogenase (cytochrome)
VASFNDCPVVNGSVYRVNASTGAVQAVLHLAEKASCIGPSVWSSPTIDPSDNSIFVSTSNANPRSNPNATCQIPDQEAVLKLDSSTLVVKALWGLSPSQQVGDSDFGATPMLFSATIGGADRQLVGAENKNGVYYALDREDLASGPVWSYQAEDAAALSSRACEDLNTISSSAWAGPGSPVMVAGITLSGSKCIGTLAALDPATGRPEWQVPLQGPVLGAVTEGSGIVAVGAASSLDVLSSSTGERLFSYTEPKPRARVGKGIYGAPVDWFWGPPTIAGKNLYAANQDGRLRAFAQPAAQ